MRPIDLTCEYLTNPIGLDIPRPRVSWAIASDRRNWRQSACQILAASRPDLLHEGQADMWDSGRMETDRLDSAEGVCGVERDGGCTVVRVGSGNYTFNCEPR
jgi:hypothetical protein